MHEMVLSERYLASTIKEVLIIGNELSETNLFSSAVNRGEQSYLTYSALILSYQQEHSWRCTIRMHQRSYICVKSSEIYTWDDIFYIRSLIIGIESAQVLYSVPLFCFASYESPKRSIIWTPEWKMICCKLLLFNLY